MGRRRKRNRYYESRFCAYQRKLPRVYNLFLHSFGNQYHAFKGCIFEGAHIRGGAYVIEALPEFFKLQYFYVISKYNLTRSLSAHIKSEEIQFIVLILP